MRGSFRIVLPALAIVLSAALCTASALCEVPPAPLCFDGPVDYAYEDGRLWVSIQKRAVTEPRLITYFVCDIQTTDPGALKSALSYDEKQTRKTTSVIAEREGAVLAVNGDGYTYHGRGIIVRDGEIHRAKSAVGFHLLLLDNKGGLSVVADFGNKNPKLGAEAFVEAGITDIWCFGPELVRGGEAASFKGFDAISTRGSVRAPRTAIGQIGPLHYVVVVVDGRQDKYSKGMSLPELQQVFVDIGAQTAYNLDGGGSTTLYFGGEVINKPCNVKERATSDIVYFK